MSTKPGSTPASVLRIPTIVLSISKLAFLPLPKDSMSCVIDLPNTVVTMSVWNLPASTGSLFSIS